VSALPAMLPPSWRGSERVGCSASWTFDARDPASAREGRARVAAQLETWGLSQPADLAGDMETIVTELITNTYEHAHVPVGIVLLTWSDGIVAVWVHDRGPGTPRPLPEPSDEGSGWDWTGWGLPMVQSIAASYGGSVLINPDPDGQGKSIGVRIPVGHP
jgi:anti-sigma regulatory factor (Ser/Thr protein kinase)